MAASANTVARQIHATDSRQSVAYYLTSRNVAPWNDTSSISSPCAIAFKEEAKMNSNKCHDESF